MDEKQDATLENNFTYHAPKPGQNEKYIALREKAKEQYMDNLKMIFDSCG